MRAISTKEIKLTVIKILFSSILSIEASKLNKKL